MQNHSQWTAPAPFWQQFAGEQAYDRIRQPAVLRFATDSFLKDLETLLATEPDRLGEYVAMPETWKVPGPKPAPKLVPEFVKRLQARHATRLIRSNGKVAPLSPERQPLKLKLYQPAHQRFYLVTGCLVCQTPGMPNRTLDPSLGERASFVIRRMVGTPGAFTKELAWVNGAWVDSSDQLVPGEEQLPLPALSYTQSDGRLRKLYTGFLPVGRRQEYLSSPAPQSQSGAPAPAPQEDPRIIRLRMDFICGWKEAIKLAAKTRQLADETLAAGGEAADATRILNAGNDQIQMMCWYALLGLVEFFETHAKHFWSIVSGDVSESNLTPQEEPLFVKLKSSKSLGLSLLEALRKTAGQRGKLETATGVYRSGAAGWPTFQFRFADAVTGLASLVPAIGFENFENLVTALLPEKPDSPVPEAPASSNLTADSGDVWFQCRLVFEREHCGAIQTPLISEATEPFLLAAFFDPDAPARVSRIELPLDTTPAGMRKFDRNSAFAISNILCGQLKKMEDLGLVDLVRSVLPFPLHKDLDVEGGGPCKAGALDIGMICSLSIPIVTICAFILLIIMVKLLDTIFSWIPFFRICFPIPGFRGKP